MIYKNSMKLLTSNFGFVWKQLAYTIVRVAIIIGLTLLAAYPIVGLLRANDFFVTISNFGKDIYTDTLGAFGSLQLVITQFFNIIGSNFGKIWYAVLLLFFIVLVINSFLKSIGKYTLTSIAHSQFTSQTAKGYCHTLVAEFKKASIYALCMLAVNLPFCLIKIIFIAFYCSVINNWILATLGITLLVILFTITYSLQLATCHNCAVSIIETGRLPFKSILNAFSSFKEFGKVFSNAIIVVLTIMVVNLAIGLFTIGAGLLITVPASMCFAAIFQLISYYNLAKQRYYLSSNIIVDAI